MNTRRSGDPNYSFEQYKTDKEASILIEERELEKESRMLLKLKRMPKLVLKNRSIIAAEQARQQAAYRASYDQLGQYGLNSIFSSYNPGYDYTELVSSLCRVLMLRLHPTLKHSGLSSMTEGLCSNQTHSYNHN